jgi:hypothetical protein
MGAAAAPMKTKRSALRIVGTHAKIRASDYTAKAPPLGKRFSARSRKRRKAASIVRLAFIFDETGW